MQQKLTKYLFVYRSAPELSGSEDFRHAPSNFSSFPISWSLPIRDRPANLNMLQANSERGQDLHSELANAFVQSPQEVARELGVGKSHMPGKLRVGPQPPPPTRAGNLAQKMLLAVLQQRREGDRCPFGSSMDGK